MAGDLEEFLKRAAARRAAKEQQPAQAAPQQKRVADQYTQRRRERVVTPPVDEEPILVAEVVEAPDAMAQRRDAVKAAKKEAARLEADAKKKLAKLQKASGEGSSPNLSFTGDARADLIRLIRQPGGIKQAILLREILDRPVNRWDD